jgi:uncharacterized protein YyaL (SSP411 family)
MAESGRKGRANHLAAERSLYLRQHADNPVEWYPWGEEAFDKARREDKPVFLSIGYSACHWCHVMARESFEDREVAELLSRSFVAVKVDKEERPDVDAVYMTVCNMVTGSGGWPLSIFLRPDKKPFWAATYLPKRPPPGGTGFVDVLKELSSAWRIHRDGVDRMADQIAAALREFVAYKEPGQIEPSLIREGTAALKAVFDDTYGGFNEAPKFPSPHRVLFLLQRYRQDKDARALEMARRTLRAMADGGIHDHVGGGFHRYSTDRQWHLPHFEKMLYDQALIALAFVEGYEATEEQGLAQVALDTIRFVLREMALAGGGFCSAIGADSEGEEGKFYVWSFDEVSQLLGDDAPLFCEAFDIRAEGNFVDEAIRHRKGTNVLRRVRSDEDLAASHRSSPAHVAFVISRCLARLRAVREGRVHPEIDDKVLTDWNGMMIAALARASRILSDPALLQAASDAATAVLGQLRLMNGRLRHRFAGGESAIDGFLDDYAFLAWGLIELGEASGSREWHEEAKALASTMVGHFLDPETGGFFMTADDAEDVLVRMKEAYDGATPSGNSMAAECLIRIGEDPEGGDLVPIAMKAIENFAKQIEFNPAAFTYMLHAYSLLLNTLKEEGAGGEEVN